MNYKEFLKQKQKSINDLGFDVGKLNPKLFDFQKFIVKIAVKKGRFGIFADCGLGKTFMQLEWANQISKKTGGNILILAPLAVTEQTIGEAEKFGIKIHNYDKGILSKFKIYITNYEQLEHVNASDFVGIVLDESSIIKNFEGAIRNKLIQDFQHTQYKLCCTATPSPNDPMELGNHSEFLNVMSRNEMLSMYFVHDGGDTAKWRIKGHAINSFWEFVSSWAIMITKPSDIGFKDTGYELPELNIQEHKIETKKTDNGMLFNDVAVNATNFNQGLRETIEERLNKTVELAIEKSNNGEDVMIWIKQNIEGDYLRKLMPNAKEVKGSDCNEYKKLVSLWFTKGKCICENQKKNILENGTKTIKTKLLHTENGQKKKGIRGVEKSTLQAQNIERNALNQQKNTGQKIQTHTLEVPSKRTTALPLNNINPYCVSKKINVPSVKENQPLSDLSKDCTLTIATKQKRLEDCCVSTVTTLSGSLKIMSVSSKELLPICKRKGKIIISKPKILGWGINMQNCHNQIFASLDFSFESLYQSIRRSYRFGQKEKVNVHLITTDTMGNVLESVKTKQKYFNEMNLQMSKSIIKQYHIRD